MPPRLQGRSNAYEDLSSLCALFDERNGSSYMLSGAAARIGDPVTHDLLAPSGVIGPPLSPPTGGMVMIEGMPAAFVSCTAVCSGATSAGMPAHPPPGLGAPPVPIVLGSTAVLINGLPAARWAPSGDMTACAAQLGDQKLLPTRTVMIGGPVIGAPDKALRLAQRKHLIATAKWQVGLMMYGPDRDKLEAAAERFERNNKAVEMARLSQDVYQPDQGPPPGWKNISSDPKELEKLGLTPDDLSIPNSDFRAQVYQPDPLVFGKDAKPTVSFKGTESGEDWSENLKQGTDSESQYYRRAVKIGVKLEQHDADVEVTGHSLGGGMATGASRASGKPATTFNSAGLHANTVEHYGGSNHEPEVENITAYRVENEVLTGLQEQGFKGTAVAARAGYAVAGPIGALVGALAKVGLSATMPDALGTKYEVPGSWDPLSRHRVGQCIAGIESQKEADQGLLTAALSPE